MIIIIIISFLNSSKSIIIKHLVFQRWNKSPRCPQGFFEAPYLEPPHYKRMCRAPLFRAPYLEPPYFEAPLIIWQNAFIDKAKQGYRGL